MSDFRTTLDIIVPHGGTNEDQLESNELLRVVKDAKRAALGFIAVYSEGYVQNPDVMRSKDLIPLEYPLFTLPELTLGKKNDENVPSIYIPSLGWQLELNTKTILTKDAKMTLSAYINLSDKIKQSQEEQAVSDAYWSLLGRCILEIDKFQHADVEAIAPFIWVEMAIQIYDEHTRVPTSVSVYIETDD